MERGVVEKGEWTTDSTEEAHPHNATTLSHSTPNESSVHSLLEPSSLDIPT